MADVRPLRLTRIRVYPLKGAAGFDLQETDLDEFGIPGDRRWMLTTPEGRFLSQRSHPRMCLIRTAPLETWQNGDNLRFGLEAPGMVPFSLMPLPDYRWVDVHLHDDRFSAVAGWKEADTWFSDFLGEPCQLVFIPDEVHRPVDPEWAPGHRVGLADGYPLHVTAEESLLELNRRLSQDTSMLQYRPNLVLAGGDPWEEDEWRALKVGEVILRLVKPCARCSVVTVDQTTGNRGREPLASMREFREWDGKIYFGQNAVFDEVGSLRVGDGVSILERGERRLTSDLQIRGRRIQ